jgi:hypothetical protein
MAHSRPIVCTSIGFTILALGAWVLVAYWTDQWVHLHALSLLRPVAAVLAVAAVCCWLAWWLRKTDPEKVALKEERVILVRTLGGVVPMAETILRQRPPDRRAQ